MVRLGALSADEEGDYLNCPMTKDEYDAFYAALVAAESATVHDFDNTKFFEGCLPIEVMAHRGEGTLRFGPMKPVGLKDPRTGRLPYAVVQLRQDTLAGDHYSLVGFQTQIKWGDQARVLRMIPGLENAEFVRYGMVHRNTYICGPKVLLPTWQTKASRGSVVCRPGVGRRRLRRVGGLGSDRRPQCRGDRQGRDAAGAAAHDRDRIAGLLRVARRSEDLPADQHHARHHAAARPAAARQDEEEADDRRARVGGPGSMVPRGAVSAMRLIAALAIAASFVPGAAHAERTRVLVRYADVTIETIVEGKGPAVVLLPSLARDSDDYDAVADGLVRRGLRVLRPQPRGIGKSSRTARATSRFTTSRAMSLK